MPLATQQQGGVGPALPANHTTAATGNEISIAIGMITAANIFGPLGTIPGLANISGWRVDRQNAPANTVNISIQRNGVNAPSTIASVFVSTNYNLAPPPVGAGPGAQVQFQARLRELERAVRQGLQNSYNSYAPPTPPNGNARVITRYAVIGQFSN